jgi:hypothetical protein
VLTIDHPLVLPASSSQPTKSQLEAMMQTGQLGMVRQNLLMGNNTITAMETLVVAQASQYGMRAFTDIMVVADVFFEHDYDKMKHYIDTVGTSLTA